MSATLPPKMSILRRTAPLSICLGLTLLTVAVFGQTARFTFLNFDDDIFISENAHLKQGLSASGMAWAFGANLTHEDATAEYWEPLTLVSRLADVQWSGMNAGAHHRTNVLLHVIAGLILFGAMRALLRSDLRAGLIAALFLIHPLHVEPVAWLAARKDILNALFFFGTIWAHARYAQRPNKSRYALVCFLFVGANMAKPMAVSLPFVLLLLDVWPLNRLRWPLIDRANLRVCAEKLPLLIIAGAVALLALVDQKGHGALGDEAFFPLPVRVANAALSYCAYLGQTFFPANLAILYPHPGRDVNWLGAAASAAFLALVSAVCIRQRKDRPWLFVGWFWFVLVLLPVSGLAQIGEMARADRYTYVSLVGIFLLCVQQFSEWANARVAEARPRQAVVAVTAAVVTGLLGISVFLAREQTKTWSDSVSVFSHAVAVTNDNYIAQMNLGSALFAAGRKAEGLAHYGEAVRIDEPALRQHLQSAMEAERQHDFAGAIQHYGKFLTVVPWNAQVHQRLGNALLQKGDYAKALVQYNEALRYDRAAIPPRLGLARVLMAQKRFDEARGLLISITRESPPKEALDLLRAIPEPAVN